jgi:hypothetical protein
VKELIGYYLVKLALHRARSKQSSQ